MWMVMAVLSAFFAGVTAVLAKCGIKKTDSDVATALRTIVVLLFSWIMVFVVGSQNTITQIEPKTLVFLVLSGLATGASWLCYFKALSLGDVNKVAPIDKSSTILTVIIAIVCFSETDHIVPKLLGTLLLAIGIFLMVERKNVDTVHQKNSRWMIYAIFSAVFAALPRTRKFSSSAAVAELRQTIRFTWQKSASSCSSFLVRGPVVIHPERRA